MKWDRDLVRLLEELNVLARRLASGRIGTDRLGLRKGSSLEFADHRAYTPGDDIRAIDWNVYAGKDQLFLKEFSAEERIHVAIAIDTSRSMTDGDPSKLACAKLTAAALAYIGLSNYDSVSLYAFSDTMLPVRQFARGKGRIFDILADLERLESSGASNLAAAFRQPPRTLKGRTRFFILSDLLDRDGWRTAIGLLAASGHEINILHCLSRDDVDPRGRGLLRLVDRESGRVALFDVTPAMADQYRERFQGYLAAVEHLAMEKETPYLRIMSDDPIDRIIVDIVRRGGMLGKKK